MHIFLINCSRTKSWGETLFVQTNQRKGDFYKTAETTKTHIHILRSKNWNERGKKKALGEIFLKKSAETLA